jgi:hypothetical protein
MSHQKSDPATTKFAVKDDERNATIRDQLTRIQDSRAFCNSARAKEFLIYVVECAVEGRTEHLKERSIGVDLFHRAPSYVTGEDPIVRVKAAEVRKRLSLYYAEEEQTPEVRIEIPVGSYLPKFHWNPLAHSLPAPIEIPTVPQNAPRLKFRSRGTAVAAVILVALGIGMAFMVRLPTRQRSNLEEFWAPVLTNGQPVLICVPSPVTYAFSSELWDIARAAHPGTYASEVERNSTPLKLDPNTPLKWKEVIPLTDLFVNKDDAYVAAQLSGFFSQLHKPNQVRIGNDFNYEDLRNSPAVLIGVFNNPWTVRMTSEMPIVFREEDGVQWIEEKGSPGRTWRPGTDGRKGNKDYAIVARFLNSKTSQFLVIVGGIGMVGTQAAGRFISGQGDLDAALRSVPSGWQGKNMEVVLESDVIDGSASTPHVLAVKTW